MGRPCRVSKWNQSSDDPHDPPRHLESPPCVPCTCVSWRSPTSRKMSPKLHDSKSMSLNYRLSLNSSHGSTSPQLSPLKISNCLDTGDCQRGLGGPHQTFLYCRRPSFTSIPFHTVFSLKSTLIVSSDVPNQPQTNTFGQGVGLVHSVYEGGVDESEGWWGNSLPKKLRIHPKQSSSVMTGTQKMSSDEGEAFILRSTVSWFLVYLIWIYKSILFIKQEINIPKVRWPHADGQHTTDTMGPPSLPGTWGDWRRPRTCGEDQKSFKHGSTYIRWMYS
jgi:hypothetical protein